MYKINNHHKRCRCPQCNEYAAIEYNDGTFQCLSSNNSPLCAFYGKVEDGKVKDVDIEDIKIEDVNK